MNMKRIPSRALALILVLMLALPVWALSDAPGGEGDPAAGDFNPEYAVTVQATEGGAAFAEPSSGPAGTKVMLTAKPDAGYRFVKWEVVSGSARVSDDDMLILPSEDVVVRAVFEPITHTLTITYVYADKSQAAPAHTETLAEGAEYEVPSPSIDGYTPDITTVSGVMGEADVDCEVVYVSNTCRIIFNANGGKGKMAAQTVKRGVTAKLKQNKFTRSGYTFKGWNTKKNGSGKAYKDSAKINLNRNTTLYAQWAKQKVKLTVKGKVTLKKNAKKVKINAKLKINNKPAKKKKLTLTVNGRKFKARTNAKGIAKFTIKRKLFKKAGKYKYTVKYGNASARGTIVVKK